MVIISEFYKRLRDLCEEKGMTINELVRILNLSSGSPTAWKSGATPRSNTVKIIADYFHVPTDYLLGNVTVTPDPNGTKTKNAPTQEGERQISDNDLKFALWGNCDDVSDEDLEDVRRYAAFIRERKQKNG